MCNWHLLHMLEIDMCPKSLIMSQLERWRFLAKTSVCHSSKGKFFTNFSCMFLNPNNFFQLEFSNCSNLFEVRNLQVQVKSFCYQKLIWPFTVWINCSSDREKLLKFVAEGREFANLLRSFFLTVGQTNFGNKILLFNFKFCLSLPWVFYPCLCIYKKRNFFAFDMKDIKQPKRTNLISITLCQT